IPILRHELRGEKNAGGIHVRKSPFDKNLTDIIFFDHNGKDLPSNKTKAVERLFFGEDFPRASYKSVGGISFPERAQESYIEKFLSTINTAAISQARFKLVIDYSNGVASTIFPNILGSLQCQALALNAYLDPKKLTRDKVEFDAAVAQLSHIVTSLGYDVGFLIDAGAEKIFVVDENGIFVKNDRLLTLITSLYLSVNPETKKIAVPIAASAEIDLIVEGKGIEVVKTRDSHLSLMEASTSKDVQFVGGTKGGFIFPDFLFASDGMYSVAKILEMMALAGKRFGALEKEVPALHLMKRSVYCPWDRKGKVMRHMMHDTEGMHRILVDGIKIIFEKDAASTSVLMRPDKAEPLFHVSAESTVKDTALSLLNKYEEKILSWRDMNES